MQKSNKQGWTRRKELVEKGRQVEAGEFVPSPQIDKKKIALVARLELDGLKEAREMADEVYPPKPGVSDLTKREQKADRAKRVAATKQFRIRNRKRLDVEKERQAADRAVATSVAS